MVNGVLLKDDYIAISNNLCQKVLNRTHHDYLSSWNGTKEDHELHTALWQTSSKETDEKAGSFWYANSYSTEIWKRLMRRPAAVRIGNKLAPQEKKVVTTRDLDSLSHGGTNNIKRDEDERKHSQYSYIVKIDKYKN